MSRLSIALCGLILAAITSASALADPLTFDFSFTSQNRIRGAGSFTATADGSNQFLIDSITGTTDTGNGVNRVISTLLAPGSFIFNDNLLFYSATDKTYSFDPNGMAYELKNGADVNLFEIESFQGVALMRTSGTELIQSADITITPASSSPVPEPESLVLLGTGVLGLAGTLRRKLAI